MYILANSGPQTSVLPHIYCVRYINGWEQFDCMMLFPEHSRREFSQTAGGRAAKLRFLRTPSGELFAHQHPRDTHPFKAGFKRM